MRYKSENISVVDIVKISFTVGLNVNLCLTSECSETASVHAQWPPGKKGKTVMWEVNAETALERELWTSLQILQRYSI